MGDLIRKQGIAYIIFIWVILLVPLFLYPFVYGWLDHENHENRALTSFKDVRASDWMTVFPVMESFFEDNMPYKNEATGAIAGPRAPDIGCEQDGSDRFVS